MTSPAAAFSKPNILLIHSDQHRFDCVGVNAPYSLDGPGRLVQTPHLDRLASQGANFTRAFTPIALCTPARASLMTGAWPSVHQSWVIPNTLGYCPALESLPNLYTLGSDAGYHIAHIGKYHEELTGTPLDHGATAFSPEAEYDRWRQSKGHSRRPMTNGFFGEVDSVDAELSRVHWGADRAIEEIEIARRAKRPFFVRWDPSEPHLPNVVCEPWASKIKPDSIPPWASFADTLKNKPLMQRRSRQRWGVDSYTWADWQPIVGRYLGEIMQIDHEIGRILEALDAAGVADNTLVIYSTDHGDFCGGHGMVDKHYAGYDEILQVPLILRWPGVIAAGVTCNRFVSHEIDLACTLINAMTQQIPASFVGRDLLDEIDATGEPRDDIFSQYSGTQQGRCDQRYLRTENYKYVYSPTSQDELYDLRVDPAELNNVVDEPEYAHALHEMRQRTERWMKQTHDKLTGPLWTWPVRRKP